MRNYTIDELEPEAVGRIAKALDSRGMNASMDGMYWLELPTALLSDLQREHAPQCGPFCLGIEVLEDGVQMELLVRARQILRCDCVAYATPEQRAYAMDELDRTLRELDIPV